MARSVRGATLLLEVMQGPDTDDPQTGVCPNRSEPTAAIQETEADLEGLRIGIPRAFFYEPLQLPGDQSPRGGLDPLNLDHRATAIPYGQTLLDISDEMDLSADAERYRRDRAKDLRLARSQGIDAVLRRHQLDALLFPGWSSEAVVNRAGYPAVVVPIGLMDERPRPPLPPGGKPSRRPFGMAFVGPACSEPTLLRMAAA